MQMIREIQSRRTMGNDQNLLEDGGDDSLDKMSAVQAGGPELDPHYPQKTRAWGYAPETRVLGEDSGSKGLDGRLCRQPVGSRFSKDLTRKIRWIAIEKDTQ